MPSPLLRSVTPNKKHVRYPSENEIEIIIERPRARKKAPPKKAPPKKNKSPNKNKSPILAITRRDRSRGRSRTPVRTPPNRLSRFDPRDAMAISSFDSVLHTESNRRLAQMLRNGTIIYDRSGRWRYY